MLTVEEQIKLIADAAMDALDVDTAAERRATPGETDLDNIAGADTGSPGQFSEEVVTMIDVKITDPPEPRQKRPMRVVVAGILAAAAAVVAIAFVVIRDADDVTPADEPSTTLPPTPLPETVPNTPGELLQPGTYFVDEVDGTPTARISFTLDAGWQVGVSKVLSNPPVVDGGRLVRGGIGSIMFSRADRVLSDACHWSDGYYPGPVATFDDLVAALSEQGGWADVTTADISVDGYAGKSFQRAVPAELWDCDTMPFNWGTHVRPTKRPLSDLPGLRSWRNGTEEFGGPGDLYEPGEVETLWVLDIDGTVVLINARLWPSATQEQVALAGPGVTARAQFAAVLDSIRIDRV